MRRLRGGGNLRQGFDDQCLGFIASRLRQGTFASGETIFERGERGDEMFLVVEGAVCLHAGPRPPVPAESDDQQQRTAAHGGANEIRKFGAVNLAAGERIAGKGDVFGEGALFPEELGPLRLESARTLSFVSALVLTAASMREIEEEYPAVRLLLPLPQGNPAVHFFHIIPAALACLLSQGILCPSLQPN